MFQICVMSSFFDTDSIVLWQAGNKTDATVASIKITY